MSVLGLRISKRVLWLALGAFVVFHLVRSRAGYKGVGVRQRSEP